jgi:hypothetical protein
MKTTMKEKVLQFVESKGSATFTEIQKFIVDHNKGEGTYELCKADDKVWSPYTKTYSRTANSFRGYYCSAFSGPKPYFLMGKDYLEKTESGKYIVVRNGNNPFVPARPWWESKN